MKLVLTVLVLATLAVAGYWYFFTGGGDAAAAQVRFRTGKVDRGVVVEGVEASGTVQPIVLVQVGTQISGVVQELLVDFNSKVKANQVVARLDTRRLQAQLLQDEAAVARAVADVERSKAGLAVAQAEVERGKASVTQAGAELDRVQALLTQATFQLERQQSLAAQELSSKTELDAAVASKSALEAQLAAAKASMSQSRAQAAAVAASLLQAQAQVKLADASVRQAEAQRESDRVNLGYATIVSPIDGVVVSRTVDVGQTVAASLQAPTLFTIANDLTKVQVQASIPEADVGRIRVAQSATFTVDAYPDRTFAGKVSQIRLAATNVQNVVTYTVLVDASNPDEVLLPGMTANVVFEVTRGPADALRVPVSALRLQPSPERIEAPPGEGPSAQGASSGTGRGGKSTAPGPAKKSRAGRGGSPRVFVVASEGRLRAVPVRVGVTDGVLAVVEPQVAGALVEGTEVVTSIVKVQRPTTTNPFSPPRFRAPRGGGR
ncbi:MAG: efflux RND transporter periplasmic adaptor subunit [Planctomycetes bacterium]|nr:efflux RND transporter periplasmic adaptor subunit [Planctomycetota bacterium]